MTAWCDGRWLAPEALPTPPAGAIAPFETMGAAEGVVALWDRHLARLRAAAARLGLPFAPAPEPELRAAATELLLQNGHADEVLRLQLVPASGGPPHTVMTTRSRGPLRRELRLLPTVVAPSAGEPPADLKANPRRRYDAVLQQAQDGGADDGIVVAADGGVLETAVGNLWLRLRGGWVTPPADGRLLPGIARAVLLERAAAAGVPIAQRPCDLGDLHAAEALAVTNAVHGPRAAALAGGAAAAVAIVDNTLGRLWRGGAPGSSS